MILAVARAPPRHIQVVVSVTHKCFNFSKRTVEHSFVYRSQCIVDNDIRSLSQSFVS